MLSQTIMWTVDSAMVGHVGKVELAAVGLGGLMVFTLYAFFIGLSYGLNTFVSQSFGASRHFDCAAYMWNGLYMALASGAVLLVIRHFNPWTIDLLAPAPEVKQLAIGYTDIRMLSAPLFILHYYFSNFFRGIGNTRTPMKIAIVANLANIILDYLLIFGKGPFPMLGVDGAAWATFTANFVSALILALVAFSASYRAKYATHRQWRVDVAKIRGLVNVGGPIGIHYFLDIGSFLVFSAYIGRMGTEQLAANQIIIQILALSFMPCNGFAVAATTLMGQYIGAGRRDLARKSGYSTIKLGLFFTGAIALTYAALPEQLIELFNNDPDVVRFGKRIIFFAAAFQIFDGIQIVAAGALRGAGDTRVPMILALGGGWFLFLPLAYLFGTTLGRGVVGAWIGATMYVVLLGIAMFAWFRLGRWEHIRLGSTPEPS